jgi:hypothetical protein
MLGMIGGIISDRFGRRTTLHISNLFFLFGSFFCSIFSSVYILIFGRFIVGFGCGLVMVVIPVYLGEIAPPSLRGAILSSHQLNITFGIFISNVLGIFLSKRPEWRFLLSFPIGCAIVQLVLLMYVPKSPKWLCRNKYFTQAEESLKILRGTEDVSEELQELKNSLHLDDVVKTTPDVIQSTHSSEDIEPHRKSSDHLIPNESIQNESKMVQAQSVESIDDLHSPLNNSSFEPATSTESQHDVFNSSSTQLIKSKESNEPIFKKEAKGKSLFRLTLIKPFFVTFLLQCAQQFCGLKFPFLISKESMQSCFIQLKFLKLLVLRGSMHRFLLLVSVLHF